MDNHVGKINQLGHCDRCEDNNAYLVEETDYGFICDVCADDINDDRHTRPYAYNGVDENDF